MISAITASAAPVRGVLVGLHESLVLRRADDDGLTVTSLGQEDRLVRGRLPSSLNRSRASVTGISVAMPQLYDLTIEMYRMPQGVRWQSG